MDKWTLGISGNVHAFDTEEEMLNYVGKILGDLLSNTELEHAAVRKGGTTYDVVFDVRLEKQMGR